MDDPRTIPERTTDNVIILVFGLVVAAGLACIDGSQIGFFKKFVAPEIVVVGPHRLEAAAELPKHEAFLQDHIGYQKTHIIMSGSCELVSLWATRDIVDSRFSIPRQVEAEFRAHGITTVRVLNLGLPLFMAGHNLHMFLRFLEDPRYRIFVWHNDFSTTALRANQMDVDPYLYEELLFLRKRFPQIPEIDEVLNTNFKCRNRYADVSRVEPEPPTVLSVSSPEKIVTTFGASLAYFLKHLFKADQNAKFLSNTFYLREFHRRLPEYLDIDTLPPSTKDFQTIGWKPNAPGFWTTYLDSAAIQGVSGEQINRDNIRTLRIMGQLAKYYNKHIYLYFGPEGRANNQENSVYTRKYKDPLIAGVKDLSTIKIIDLTAMPFTEGVDSYSSVNLSYSGNQKAAKKIFEILYRDDYAASH